MELKIESLLETSESVEGSDSVEDCFVRVGADDSQAGGSSSSASPISEGRTGIMRALITGDDGVQLGCIVMLNSRQPFC